MELDYHEIVRKTNERMLRPIENNIMNNYGFLRKEWDVKLNNGANPEYFSKGSAKRILWTCTKCKGIWSSTISNRIEFKTGCPYWRYNIFTNRYYTMGGSKRRKIPFGKNNL